MTLDRVGFRYAADDRPALSAVSTEIPATGLTAIVGPSGAGKSTLVKLLLRFFDPDEGRILVDGVSLSELRLADWRRRVAHVPQKVFLFNATVRDNIAFGDMSAGDSEIVAAAKAAGAHAFIETLPQGYATRLGADGMEVSGGEGQRICLARALLRKPALLLLDEATNALDSLSEARFQQALEDVRQHCAVVVIAHRLATIESADRILVLDGGRLVEQGTLQQLREGNGLFTRMYELQQFAESHQGFVVSP